MDPQSIGDSKRGPVSKGRSRRQTGFLIGAALIVLSLASCARRDVPNAGTVVVALSAPPSTIDPRYATDATGSRLAGLLFSSLVRIGNDLKPVPDAAESWLVEGAKITFKLRQGITFSNGRALTANDVLYSFDQVRDPKSPFHSSFASIKNVEAHFDAASCVVVVTLERPSATFLTDLPSVKLLPQAELLKNPEAFADRPIGTGPFALDSMSSDEIRLRARHDHPYAAPKIEYAVFKVVRDDNTRALKMARGELDLAQAEFPPLKVRMLEKNSALRVLAYPGLAMSYLLINHADSILSQKNVRRAIAEAIDRDSITKFKLEGLAQPATSLLTPSNPFFDSALRPLSFDVSAAKKLIASASVGGTKLDAKLELKTSNVATGIDNGRIISRELDDIGLNVVTRSFEWATFYADIQAGRFQMAIMRWVGTIDPDLYRKAFHSKEIPPVGRNRGHYVDRKLDELLEQGATTVDATLRRAIYNKVQEQVFEDLAIIPLWYDTEVAVVNRRIEGYNPPTDGSYWPLTQVTKK